MTWKRMKILKGPMLELVEYIRFAALNAYDDRVLVSQ